MFSEKLLVANLVKNDVFNGTRYFITVFSRVRQLIFVLSQVVIFEEYYYRSPLCFRRPLQ